MDEKRAAMLILGSVIMIAVAGIIITLTTGETGALVQKGGIYTNYQGDPFPYTRKINKVTENPASYGVQTEAQIPSYGGASETFGGWHNPGAEVAVSKGFVYARDPQKKIYQVLTSCTGQANIGAIPPGYTRGASFQHAQTIGLENCVEAPEQVSVYAYCCKEPSQTY